MIAGVVLVNRLVTATCWGLLALAPVTLVGAASGSPLAAVGQVNFVQAVPAVEVAITVDDEAVEPDATTGDVVGPVDLAPGEHTVTFEGEGVSVSTKVEVSAGTMQDVVVHLPAAVGGDPVVSRYPTPRDPIGPDKARVLVAHTATVAPADVRVDGQVVFTNIANGEYATADVPAGEHEVALLPTGTTGDPILGPLTVTVQPLTVTMVYAVGNPEDDSMELIAHALPLAADGSVAPGAIDTGSAGLVSHWKVHEFGSARAGH
jgi:hypothetical protein